MGEISCIRLRDGVFNCVIAQMVIVWAIETAGESKQRVPRTGCKIPRSQESNNQRVDSEQNHIAVSLKSSIDSRADAGKRDDTSSFVELLWEQGLVHEQAIDKRLTTTMNLKQIDFADSERVGRWQHLGSAGASEGRLLGSSYLVAWSQPARLKRLLVSLEGSQPSSPAGRDCAV